MFLRAFWGVMKLQNCFEGPVLLYTTFICRAEFARAEIHEEEAKAVGGEGEREDRQRGRQYGGWLVTYKAYRPKRDLGVPWTWTRGAHAGKTQLLTASAGSAHGTCYILPQQPQCILYTIYARGIYRYVCCVQKRAAYRAQVVCV